MTLLNHLLFFTRSKFLEHSVEILKSNLALLLDGLTSQPSGLDMRDSVSDPTDELEALVPQQ